MQRLRIMAGAVLWLAAALSLTAWARSFPQRGLTPADKIAGELREYFVARRSRLTVRFEQPIELAIGEPLLVDDGGRPIGWIETLIDPATHRPCTHAVVDHAEILLDGSAPPVPIGSKVLYRSAPHSLTEILQILIPEPKRAKVLAELQAVFVAHQEEMATALMPIVEASVEEVLSSVEGRLGQTLQKHRIEIARLAAKYEHELVEQKIVPLVQGVVWPILQRRASPVAGQIGKEVWQRASLWRFGWRYLYDSAPLPDMQLTDREWQRFVTEDVAPVLESHVEELVELLQQVLGDSARHPEVQAVMKFAARKIFDDPELRTLARKMLRETLIDNPEVWTAVRKRWTSPQAQEALRLCAAKMEPALRRVGDSIFGTQEGISPEFARVLRCQILGKDQHWLILASPTASRGGVVVGVVETSTSSP